MDLKLFETAIADGGRPKTTAELALPTGASPKLVDRIARTVAAMGFLSEKGPSLYAPSSLTDLLTQPVGVGGIRFWCVKIILTVSQAMPVLVLSF